MPVLDPKALLDNRVAAIRDYHRSTGIDRAELDVSGGVDSAVMLGLLVRALGADKVTGVYSSINSSEQSRARARAAGKAFGATVAEVALEPAFEAAVQQVVIALANAGLDRAQLEQRMKDDPIVLGSFRSCLRAPVGRFVNRLTGGGIRHGTGNECEDRWLRFYQKGGDGEVDSNPIAMLAKGEVFQLGLALGVPDEILTATPTPDLWGVGEEHTDERELAAISGVDWTYSRVDPSSGLYTRVGTIERLSRALDCEMPRGVALEEVLFGSAGIDNELPALIEVAKPSFPGLSDEEIAAFLASARKWERITRHKFNPNCPSLGARSELLAAGILTNTLPEETR